MRIKDFIFLCFLIFSTSVLALEELDRSVAIVNDEVISFSELENYTKVLSFANNLDDAVPASNTLQKQILQRLVLNKIQLQIANSTGLEVEDDIVNQSIESFAHESDLSVAALKQQLASKGIKYRHFVDFIHDELLTSKLQQRELSQDIAVSKTDVDGFLNSPAGQDQTGAEYKISHILISVPDPPTPEELTKVQQHVDSLAKDLTNGADFSQVAISHSNGQQALSGGDLGWRRLAEIPSLFVNLVPGMKVGEISTPIRNATGFHIIKLQDKKIATDSKPHLELHLRHILIKTKKRTDADAKAYLATLRNRIENGETFNRLAQQYSEEISTSIKGGDIGWVTEDELLPGFYKSVINLKEQQISQPFKTDMGWHLVQMLAKRTQDNSQDAARNKAIQLLRNKKYNEMLEAWLKRIRNDASINILLS